MQFQAPSSPVLFSSAEQSVPQGEEENGYQDQGGAGVEGAKYKPRGFVAEELGDWMDSTMSSLGVEEDQCITVGQLCPPMAFMVRNEVQGDPFEAVVDTGAEVTVLGKEVNDRLREKPPIRRLVTRSRDETGDYEVGWGWCPPERLNTRPL